MQQIIFSKKELVPVWYLGSSVAKTEDIGSHVDNVLNTKPGSGS